MAAVQGALACINEYNNYNIQVDQVIECLENHDRILLKYN